MDDKRFVHIVKDPKFRRIPKSRQKVKIDKRFQSMFNDKKFDSSHKIDKRGRPINYKTNTNLKQFYELDSDDENDDSSNSTKSSEDETTVEKVETETDTAPNNNDDEEANNDVKTVKKQDNCLSEDIKKKLRDMDVDYARGKSRLIAESSSDDDDDETEIEDEIDEIDHNWGELDKDAETTNEISYRLAACNMDWDRIRAIDLMVLFNSFLPQNGAIKSVAIYPSEFGKARMKEEEIKGPIELVENNNNDDDDNNEEGTGYHMEKLRQYQLNRLKYYYAVITFDCANSANRIYNECDGMEYESTATKLDLRIIPDDMIFDDVAKEFCDKLPELNKYQPRFFTTTALQQVKVDLTWDETDLERIEIVKKFNSGKIDEINDDDLKNYIASSSGDSDVNDNNNDVDDDDDEKSTGKNSIDKYRKLLQEIEKNDDDDDENEEGAMEMKWDLKLEQKTDEIMKQKQEDNEDKTPFQKYLDKRKEKRKEKKLIKKQNGNDDADSDLPSDIDLNDPYFAEEFDKIEFKKKSTKKSKNNEEEKHGNNEKNAELELLLMNEDDDDDNKQHFSLKKIQENENSNKKKNRNKKKRKDVNDGNNEIQDDFEINVNDDRFTALFTNHLYNIDQTDPHYKKTKGTETLINEKLKRRIQQDPVDDANNKKLKTDNELNMLVKSIKRKKHK